MHEPIPPIQAEYAEIPRTSSKAITSLVLGIGSFFCSIFTGIPAIILGILAVKEVGRSRGAVTGRGMAIAGIVLGGFNCVMLPISLALMFPAIGKVLDAVRATQSMAKMAEIGSAIRAFEATNDSYPADSQDATGRALLSWRVHILPQLGEQALYSQFRLNEPWDSPHNRALISKMPITYLVTDSGPRAQNSGRTGYLALVKSGSPFDGTPGSERGVRPQRDQPIADASRIAMLVEVDEDHEVEWTRPADLAGNEQSMREALGARRSGLFHLVLYADGHVEHSDALAK